jgi:hypothetical protein
VGTVRGRSGGNRKVWRLLKLFIWKFSDIGSLSSLQHQRRRQQEIIDCCHGRLVRRWRG